MPQLGRHDGCVSTAILLLQPTEESPHLPFDLCCIHFHPVLLDPASTLWQGYYGLDHGAGHPRRRRLQVEAPKPLKNWEFGDPFPYAGWPKVAGAVIEAQVG